MGVPAVCVGGVGGRGRRIGRMGAGSGWVNGVE